MRYLTDRKRAIGWGSAKSGTEHFWSMKVSSYALLVLIPLFVFTTGAIIGEDFATVTAYYARPFPTIVAALTIAVSMKHFKDGVRTLIEDYVHGPAQHLLIIGTLCLSYAATAVALFALLRMAL